MARKVEGRREMDKLGPSRYLHLGPGEPSHSGNHLPMNCSSKSLFLKGTRHDQTDSPKCIDFFNLSDAY